MDANAIDGIARSLAGGRSRRSLLKGLAGGLAVAAAAKLGVRDVEAADVSKVVRSYYDAIEKRQWSTAYNYLGSDMRAAQSLSDFIAGFNDTAFTQVFTFDIGAPSSGVYPVDSTVQSWLNDGSPQRFEGTYFVGKENGVYKIVDASLQVQSASGIDPLCKASQLKATVQDNSATSHRYADITVTKKSGGNCTLVGIPGVLIKDANGGKVIRGKREAGSSLISMPLTGQNSALLQLDWTNWCGSGLSNPISASITLAGNSGHLTLSNPIGVPPCVGQTTESHLTVRPWQSA